VFHIKKTQMLSQSKAAAFTIPTTPCCSKISATNQCNPKDKTEAAVAAAAAPQQQMGAMVNHNNNKNNP
jgi:hypothetical protein